MPLQSSGAASEQQLLHRSAPSYFQEYRGYIAKKQADKQVKVEPNTPTVCTTTSDTSLPAPEAAQTKTGSPDQRPPPPTLTPGYRSI